jgi:hypothetical protein
MRAVAVKDVSDAQVVALKSLRVNASACVRDNNARAFVGDNNGTE